MTIIHHLNIVNREGNKMWQDLKILNSKLKPSCAETLTPWRAIQAFGVDSLPQERRNIHTKTLHTQIHNLTIKLHLDNV